MRAILQFGVWVLVLAAAARAEITDFVTRQGDQLAVDGQPFYYAGANSFYLSYFHQDPAYRPMIDEVLTEAQSMGVKVMRTWAFNDGGANLDGYPTSWALQTSPGVYNEAAFEGLDYVLHRADQLGIRVTLTLVNNWDDYGGMNWYNGFSPTATWHDEFYTDFTTRQWYKDHLGTVLNRVNTFNGRVYKDDPAIFAWELANEPRGSTVSAASLHAWIDEMSTFIKSEDPNHLITTGLEGFYASRGPEWFNNGSTGTDFIANHDLPNIDLASLHLYPDVWGWDLAQTLAWLQQHIDEAGSILGKPLILGEFGSNLPIAERDAWFAAYFNEIYAAAAQGKAIAGSHFWMLEGDASGHDDGFGIFSPADASTIALISQHAADMNSLSQIPEPGKLALFAAGLLVLALRIGRRTR